MASYPIALISGSSLSTTRLSELVAGTKVTTNAIDTNTTVLSTDNVLVFATTANRTCTLPDPATVPGKQYVIIKSSNNAFTVAISPAAGAIYPANVTLGARGEGAVFVSDGANYYTYSLNRVLTGTADQITVTNGNGAAGVPTISLPNPIKLGSGPAAAGELRITAASTFSGIGSLGTSTAARTHYQFENPNGVVGSISTSGTATTYATSSGEDVKKNLEEFKAGSLDKLTSLSIKKGHFKDQADSEPKQVMFIAENVKEVYPEAVVEATDTAPIMIDYGRMAPMIAAAVQELAEKVTALEARIIILEGKTK